MHKKLFITAFSIFIALYSYSQDGIHLPLTGGTITGPLAISANLDGSTQSRFKIYGAGSSYFDIWKDANQTPNLTLQRSDGAEVFKIMGHTMTATFGGAVQVGHTLNLNGGPGSYREISFRTNGALRWDLYTDPTAETGNSAGSNLSLASYTDEGAYHRNIFTANRGTGDINFGNNLSINGALTGTSASFGGGSIASTTATNISQFNDIRINGSHADASINAITYQSGGGGGAAIAFYRGGSYDTGIKFYTNPYTGGSGALQQAMSIDGNKNVNMEGVLTGTSANFTGNVAIGSTQTNSNLYVNGTVKSKEVKVEATVSVPDYVFEKSYDLKSLQKVEKYITENKHLPEIPSARVIEKEGINVGEMQLGLLKKIEELTLYIIDINKTMEAMQQKNLVLEKEIAELKSKK